MTKVNTGFGRYTNKRQYMHASLKMPTCPMDLNVSKPNGLVLWENLWEQRGERGRLMAEGL